METVTLDASSELSTVTTQHNKQLSMLLLLGIELDLLKNFSRTHAVYCGSL
jgi:hypothetical protein